MEKHLSKGGQARRAGVGETEGDGEEPRVKGGEGIGESSPIVDILRSRAVIGETVTKLQSQFNGSSS